MKYSLHIDTSNTEAVVIALIGEDGTRFEKHTPSLTIKSQTVLPAIEMLFHETHVQWEDVKDITVATGPGSFTGLRVGASVGATISWLLSIPINTQALGTIPHLEYGEDKWKLNM